MRGEGGREAMVAGGDKGGGEVRGETRPPPPLPPLFSLYAPVGNGEERRCGGEREDLTCLFGPTFPVT